LGEEVELELQESQIVIRPSRTPRQNLEEQFQQMAAQGDDQLLDSDFLATTWDEAEWEW
jgi:antitoxin MazE